MTNNGNTGFSDLVSELLQLSPIKEGTCQCGCGENLVGKKGKKFVSGHRNKFHNKNNRIIANEIFEPYEKVLRKNWKALDKHFGKSRGKNSIDLYEVIADGFKAKFFIGFIEMEYQQERIYHVYNYSFQIINNKIIIYHGKSKL